MSSAFRCAADVCAFTSPSPRNWSRAGVKQWPFPDLQWKGHRWVDPDMEDVFTAYSQGYSAVLKPLPKAANRSGHPQCRLQGIPAHPRDCRVLILLLTLPPIFTLVFGHAFEAGEMTDAPAVLVNADATPRAQRFVDQDHEEQNLPVARATAGRRREQGPAPARRAGDAGHPARLERKPRQRQADAAPALSRRERHQHRAAIATGASRSR